MIGPLRVLVAEQAVEVPAEVCLREGILDYLIIAPGSAKEYETLFVAKCEPSQLHAALLAVGARPGSVDLRFRGDRRGDPLDTALAKRLDSRPPGTRVRMLVRRKGGGFIPVERWLIDRRTGAPPERLEHVFSGSWFGPDEKGGERYVADMYHVMAALWYDGTAPLNAAVVVGSPYRGDRMGFAINTRAVPAIRTRVTLRLEVVHGAK